MDAFKSWLKEQEEAQAKKQPTEEPAFKSADVLLKWAAAEKAVQKTDKKSKPKPPPAAKKNETETADAKADKKEGGDAAEGADKSDDKAGADATDAGSKPASDKADAKPEQAESEEEELPSHEEL